MTQNHWGLHRVGLEIVLITIQRAAQVGGRDAWQEDKSKKRQKRSDTQAEHGGEEEDGWWRSGDERPAQKAPTDHTPAKGQVMVMGGSFASVEASARKCR